MNKNSQSLWTAFEFQLIVTLVQAIQMLTHLEIKWYFYKKIK